MIESFIDFFIYYNSVIYDDMILRNGDLFIPIEKSDLVNLVKQIMDEKYIV
jgi:hypothetical protein